MARDFTAPWPEPWPGPWPGPDPAMGGGTLEVGPAQGVLKMTIFKFLTGSHGTHVAAGRRPGARARLHPVTKPDRKS